MGCLQFAVGGVIALLMWTFKLHEKPKVSADTVSALQSPSTSYNLLSSILMAPGMHHISLANKLCISKRYGFCSVHGRHCLSTLDGIGHLYLGLLYNWSCINCTVLPVLAPAIWST